MELGDYLRASNRSVHDLHCACRVSYKTVLELSKNERRLHRVDIAKRIVDECEGEVTLEDVLHEDCLKALRDSGAFSPTDKHAPDPPQSGTSEQGDGSHVPAAGE